VIQLLLGNIGRPGGGIMALRGHASIQGSTDIPTLYNTLPGYLQMKHVDDAKTLQDYIEAWTTASSGPVKATTTPASWARTRGGTSRSSSSASR
jgi:anaerobic selenocysteine-containing dehydrogenase